MPNLPALALAALGVGLVYVVWRIRRDGPNPVLHCLAVIFVALTIALLAGRVAPYTALARLTGVSNLARLVQHASAATMFCAGQILIQYMVRPSAREARASIPPRVLTLVVVLIVMTIMFWQAPLDAEAPVDFVQRYSATPWVGPYLLVFLAYLTIGILDIIRVFYRSAQSADRPVLRRSIWIIIAAGVIGLAYTMNKGLFALSAWLSLPVIVPWAEDDASRLLVSSGTILTVAAAVVPTFTIWTSAAWRTLRDHRLHRAMHPLWAAATAAVPTVVLPAFTRDLPTPPRLRQRAAAEVAKIQTRLEDLRWEMYRRPVEIQDALLALRFYRHPAASAVAHTVAGDARLTGEHRRALIEAVDIAAAIRMKESGADAATEADGPALTAGAADIKDWLARVSRTYASSPHVERALTSLQLPAPGRVPRDRSF